MMKCPLCGKELSTRFLGVYYGKEWVKHRVVSFCSVHYCYSCKKAFKERVSKGKIIMREADIEEVVAEVVKCVEFMLSPVYPVKNRKKLKEVITNFLLTDNL